MSTKVLNVDLLSQIQDQLRQSNNIVQVDEEGIHEPTAMHLVELIELQQERPVWPRSPHKEILNLDDEVMCRVADYADSWDLSKSKTVELMLKIAVRELQNAWSEINSNPDNYDLQMEES